jgi:hypothetical protein
MKMTQGQFAMGLATFLTVVVVGFLSTNSVNQYFDVTDAAKSACVRANGSWKNWSWSNVPMLSPKCSDKAT